MSRKIGSITPIWNQELFLKPHFEMLSKLDKNVVLLHERPLPDYHKEHGYSTKPDLSEKILRKYFPNVEIYKSEYPEGKEFGADIYNEGLKYVQDCDIVFRLDPDMFFEDQVWDDLLSYIQNTNYDYYQMDFAQDSIDYYETGKYSFGVKDAKEMDPLAFSPKYELTNPHGTFEWAWGNETIIKFPGFFCHHFRGWNKPKSTPVGWHNGDYARTMLELYGNDGEWHNVPKSIQEKEEKWLKELEEIKNETR